MAEQLSVETYQRAEALQAVRLHQGNIFRAQAIPARIGQSNSFWYRVSTQEGPRFMVVDADAAEKRAAFDHDAVAKALGATLGREVSGSALPIMGLDFSREGQVGLRLPGALYWWDATAAQLTADEHGATGFNEAASPDGRWAAYAENHDLYIRSLQNGERRQLTTDGELRCSYATHPEGIAWSHELEAMGFSMPPPLVWNRDGTRFVTLRMDERDMGEHWYVRSSPADQGKPTMRSKAYPMPGDERLSRIDYVLVDAASGEVTETGLRGLDSPYMAVLGAGNTHFAGDVLYAVHRDRWHRKATLSRVEVATGATTTVLTEASDTHLDMHPTLVPCNARFLEDRVIWWSERSGWGHLYLYDLASGELIRPLTEGDWLVHTVLAADEEFVWFTGCGRDAEDPYLQRLYRVAIKTGEVSLLDAEATNHAVIGVGDYFVDNMADVQDFGRSVLRSRAGEIVMQLEEAETRGLEDLGFRFPERVSLTAADGETTIWANVWLPAEIEEGQTYPVIEDCYPGPQINKCAINLNTAFGWGDCLALTALGFIVVQLDGRGTPFRDKAFHDHSYGNIHNGSDLDDHVAGLQQLAERYPLDLDRVGIYGVSGGGFMSTRAMFTKPETYKVAVSLCGNHDQRIYWSNWGEKYHGPVDEADYVDQSNTTHAANLQGKLLLIHGELDDNVSPAHTLRVVDQLIQNDLDFDMVIVPNAGHMFLGKQAFVTRRRWDYFVRHLMGCEPPAGFHLQEPPMDLSILSSMFGSDRYDPI